MGKKRTQENGEVGRRDVTERGQPRATRSGVTFKTNFSHGVEGNWAHEKYTSDCVNTQTSGGRPPAPVIKTTRYAAVSFLCACPQLSTLPLVFPAWHFSCQHKHGGPLARRGWRRPGAVARSSGQDYSIMPTGPLFRLNVKNKRGSLWRVQEARLRASVSSIPSGPHRGCRVPVKPPHIY